jgi:hypothetical protein
MGRNDAKETTGRGNTKRSIFRPDLYVPLYVDAGCQKDNAVTAGL